jgi:alpha-mannosidase
MKTKLTSIFFCLQLDEIWKLSIKPTAFLTKMLLFIAIFPIFNKNISGQTAKQDFSWFKNGKLLVVPSSHQDIAYMDTPAKCIEFRDEKMITPALELLRNSKHFSFTVENAMNLYEYLERHPERLEEISKYTCEGRLEWGANYNQPYEGMYDGEALIRQMYIGKKLIQKIIPGAQFSCAWDLDVPARTFQRPQMLAKAGVKYLMFSRFSPGIYRWFSPDGSYITCWSPGKYDFLGRAVHRAITENERTEALKQILANFNPYFKSKNLSPNFIYINSYDFSEPPAWDSYFDKWNQTRQFTGLPEIEYSTGSKAIEMLANGGGYIDTLIGERPNTWLYIHGPTHERALKAGRKASRTLTAAEKFSTIHALLKKDISLYPQNQLNKAWADGIYPDHGWGGNWGFITDTIFKSKFESALAVSDSLLRMKTQGIGEMIDFKNEKGLPIVVFNPVSWERTDQVEVLINMEGIYVNQFKLVDETGKNIDFQFIKTDASSSASVVKILFIAEKVPSIGYKTFYFIPGEWGESHWNRMDFDGETLNNGFYKIKMAKGGVESIIDKSLQKELIQSDKFLCGEVFSMESVGTGAGEFTDIQQPNMIGFEKMSQYGTTWQLIEHGVVRTVLESVHPWAHCTVRQRVIVYNRHKLLQFEVDILGFDGFRSREFRVAFPLRMENSQIAYRVPMGVVEVGRTEMKKIPGYSTPWEIYSTPPEEIRPREVQDWFSAREGNTSVTISTDVAVFDYNDPTSNQVSYPILQPLLMATRRSVNRKPDSNWYLQRGDHHFSYNFYSHSGDWKEGRQLGEQQNNPLIARVIQRSQLVGILPELFSFASVDKKNIIISTIKKCDDDNSVILRAFEIEGKDTEVKLDWFKGISTISKTNIIEEVPQKLKIGKETGNLHIGKFSIETYKIE